jgi:SAM-dependent methyltransferase
MMTLERVDCPKCGAAEQSVIAEGEDFLYGVAGTFFAAQCSQCGLWFQSPRPRIDDFTSLYTGDYIPHEGEDHVRPRSAGELEYLRRALGYAHLPAQPAGTRARVALARPWYRWLAGVRLEPRYVPHGRLLEIGCGSGGRLVRLRDCGWRDLTGIELVPAAAERARAKGFDVVCARVEEALQSFGDESFDVVVSEMVMEHLVDPFLVIDAVARVLRPGGEFLFSTIVRDSPDVALYGRYWAGFDFPRHMVYARKSDLAGAMNGAFEALQAFHQVAPVDYVRSSSWRRRGGEGTAFDALIARLGTSKAHKAMHVPLAFAKRTCRVSFCSRKRRAT